MGLSHTCAMLYSMFQPVPDTVPTASSLFFTTGMEFEESQKGIEAPDPSFYQKIPDSQFALENGLESTEMSY